MLGKSLSLNGFQFHRYIEEKQCALCNAEFPFSALFWRDLAQYLA